MHPHSVPDDEQDAAYLGALTGVRSGKRSFYPAYMRSAQRLENTLGALDRISQALVHTAQGPRALVEAVVNTAAEHLRAEWLLFVVADGVLPATRPRVLLLHGDQLVTDVAAFPPEVAEQCQALRQRPWEETDARAETGPLRVVMMLDGEPVGGIAGQPGAGVEVAETDLAILRVLANQAAVALHNSYLVHATAQLRGRTEQLSEAAARQARDLAARNAELQQTQRRLIGAMQRQALDDERHRIARELHDSVTQDVLSAGMALEIVRAELTDPDLVDRLAEAKGLTQRAVERLRAAIYALHNTAEDSSGTLPELLKRLSTVHLPSELDVSVTVQGKPVPLCGEAEHALLRITGEALFNTVMHTCATRALVRLHYRGDHVRLSVSDNGGGDARQVRRSLRLSSAADLTGAHRGLANMRARVERFGGALSVRASRIGGITVAVELPVGGARSVS